MLKTMGIVILVLVVLVMFIAPIRNYCTNLLHKDKSELSEVQIIGTVSGYSPRVEEIQKILKEAHFDPGSTDGAMGNRTRQAIREFQKKKGLLLSGKVDSRTWLELNRERVGFAEKATVQPLVFSSGENLGDLRPEEEIVRIRGPQGKMANVNLPKDRKKQIQVALQKAGFYNKKIDGKIGPKTKEAIKVFQKAKGLRVDGIVGTQTRAELNKYLKD